MTERGIFAYDPQFDKRDYSLLRQRKPIEEIDKKKESLDSYVRRQFETHLGERYNVLLSTTEYDLSNGKIYGRDMDEPFVDVIEKGVNWRKKHGSKKDHKREEAELIGFRKIENLLGDSQTPLNTMMISISPKGEEGSTYTHNFYDIFTLRQKNETRYIEARRYSSSLSIDEYEDALSSIKTFDNPPKPEDLLSDPIVIQDDVSADDIHTLFHREHEYLTNQEFEDILKFSDSLISNYIRTLSEVPLDEEKLLLTYNAILNKCDLGIKLGKNRKPIFQSQKDIDSEIQILGRMAVRVVSTACGQSGGFSVGGTPFSVSEYANGPYRDTKEWFNCPKCKYKASGPVGNRCPGCGLTKERYVSEGGKKC